MVAGVTAGMEKLDKEVNRRRSHCSHNGHNARTCPDRGIKLFGVRMTEGMRKSVSLGNLSHYGGSSNQTSTLEHSELGVSLADGYVSDGLVQTSSNARERKKGVPWTEEEHRLFLIGLQKLGKGDWRGIARNFVTTRTPTQVASHAQKFFIRQCNLNRRKRRSSLFDIAPEPESIVKEELVGMVSDASIPVHQLGTVMSPGQSSDADESQRVEVPLGPLSPSTLPSSMSVTELGLGSIQKIQTEMKANNEMLYDCEAPANLPGHPVEPSSIFQALVPVHLPFQVPWWLETGYQMFSHGGALTHPSSSNVFKPTPTLSTGQLWINKDPKPPELSLRISPPSSEASLLNLNLEEPSRQSAFHSRKAFNSSNSTTHEGVEGTVISVI